MARVRVDLRDAAAAAPSGFAAPAESAALVPFGARAPASVASAASAGELPGPVASSGTPPSAMPGGEASATGVGSTSSLRRGFARVARIGARVILNAAIAIALMTLVPLTLAAVRGSDLQRLLHTSGVNTDARVQAVRGLRAFGVAPDASITPLRAGLALNALQPSHYSSPGFPTINVVRPAAPWRTTPLAADLFPDARPRLYSGPSS